MGSLGNKKGGGSLQSICMRNQMPKLNSVLLHICKKSEFFGNLKYLPIYEFFFLIQCGHRKIEKVWLTVLPKKR